MKKLIVLLLMLLPFAGDMNAQEAKIDFVNAGEIFTNMHEFKDMQK